MKRVFISSVMKGFEEQRGAARKAVESLRMTPVMAEDFGAQPVSSQVACLEGIRSSDIFVLLLGPRYGFVAPSGKSVTEEEFLEARSRGLPILAFVSRGDLEPDQKAFFGRVGDYDSGYFVSFFENPHDLQTKVTTAVHDQTSQPGVSTVPPAVAADRMRQLLAVRNPTQFPLLNAVIFPTRTGEEYISPLDMSREPFRNALAQQAMFGPTAVFDAQAGYQPQDGREHLRLQQGDPRGRWLNAVELHADGTVFMQSTVSNPKDQLAGFGAIGAFVIDEDVVRTRLLKFFAFANATFATMTSSPLITTLYASVSLSGIAHRHLGKLTDQPSQSSIQLPMHQIDDPLIVPTTPLKVSRADLGNGEALAEKYLGFIKRAFRATVQESAGARRGWS